MGLVSKTIIILFVALFGAEILVELGVMRRLEPIGRPLARWAHLPPESALSFIAAFGSVLTANAMISGYYSNNRINHKEMVLSALLNSVPGYIKEIFIFLPIVFPLVGLRVGSVYLVTFVLTALTHLAITVFFGRILLPPRPAGGEVRAQARAPVSLRQAAKKAFLKQKGIFFRIVLMLVGMTYLISFLAEEGILQIFEARVASLTQWVGLPAVVITPLTAYLASPLAGVTAVGALLKKGIITDYQGILTVLLGGMLMLPVLAIRSRLPNSTAIFGFRCGLCITGISVATGIIIRLVLICVVILFIPETG
jgi:hypothetical protein